MAAGSCDPLGMPESTHPLLGGTHLHAQSQELQHMPQEERPDFGGWSVEGVWGLSGSSLSEAIKRVCFSSGKTFGDCCHGKHNYCQTQKCFLICLLIFGASFWTVLKVKSNHTHRQFPALLPTLPSRTQGKIRNGKSW